MRISTLSVIAGTGACNATCPFCVSKMTGQCNEKVPNINLRNFEIACRLAKRANVTTAMITGKGEPTLFPNQITKYIKLLFAAEIPLIELQTNGIKLADKEYFEKHVASWYAAGLTTIALSIVDSKQSSNAKIYGGDHYDLIQLIAKLHSIGITVRLSVVLLRENCDHYFFEKMLEFARTNSVEQLTFTPVNAPSNSQSLEIREWVSQNRPEDGEMMALVEYVQHAGHKLLELPHGAVVYDVDGQNVCLSNCLSASANNGQIRNLIFYPNGRLAYDWQFKGAVIL